MEAKHTPGPWVAEREADDANDLAIVASDTSDRISNPSRGMVAVATRLATMSANEQFANARLIAAAPDLLAALKEFVDLAREHREACKASGERPVIDAGRLTRGLAAIAKATA